MPVNAHVHALIVMFKLYGVRLICFCKPNHVYLQWKHANVIWNLNAMHLRHCFRFLKCVWQIYQQRSPVVCIKFSISHLSDFRSRHLLSIPQSHSCKPVTNLPWEWPEDSSWQDWSDSTWVSTVKFMLIHQHVMVILYLKTKTQITNLSLLCLSLKI